MHRKLLFIRFVALFVLIAFGAGSLPLAHAQTPASTGLASKTLQTSASELVGGYVVSDGQFVYGPNIGGFNLKNNLKVNAPHLLKYADDLYGRSEYFSINPKIYLTLLEIHSHLISTPDAAVMEDPFGLKSIDFISQIDYLSNKMTEAYYLHLYSYSSLPVSQRNLSPFVTSGSVAINVAPETNAGTYAIIAGLAAIDQQNISLILDNSQLNGFYQTYIRLFGNDDPLDEKNQIAIPAEAGVTGASSASTVLAAPAGLLQLPYLQGLSWKFGGVHNATGGGGVGSPLSDASSLDFYPSGSSWGMDTSNMWVVAAASGIPTKFSATPPNTHACGFKVSHSGAVNVGWETTYYHLDIDPSRSFSNPIRQNDKIGVIANTEAQAICTGGAASGPHVHFSLKYNGAYVAINGTSLSGWYVNCNASNSCLNNYDTNPTHMWLERVGSKKYPFNSTVLSEDPLAIPTVFLFLPLILR